MKKNFFLICFLFILVCYCSIDAQTTDITDEIIFEEFPFFPKFDYLDSSEKEKTFEFIKQLLKDSNKEIRIKAIFALGQITQEYEKVVPLLNEMFKDTEPAVIHAVVTTLREKFKRKAKASIPELIQLSNSAFSKNYKSLQIEIIKTFGEIGTGDVEVINFLSSFLDTKNDINIKREAILSLGKLGTQASSVVPSIALLLEEEELVDYVIWALGEIGPSAYTAIPKLLELLQKDQFISKSILICLLKIRANTKDVFVSILPFLRSEDWQIRCSAARIVSNIGSKAKEAIPLLLKNLNVNSEYEKLTIIHALGEISINNKEVIPILESYLVSENIYIQKYSEEALKKIKKTEEEKK